MKHDNFPDEGEVVRRLEELEEWKKYTNRIIFGIVTGSMGTILAFGIWVGGVQTDATNNARNVEVLSSDHHDIDCLLYTSRCV